MRRSDTKGRPVEHFSILVVPRNRSHIRRFELSRRALYGAASFIVVVACLCAVVFVSFLYYRGVYLTTEHVRIQSADFSRERAFLLDKLTELEGAVRRTDRFAAKLERDLAEQEGRFVGKGPVDEQDWLPSPHSMTAPSPRYLGEGMWRPPFSNSFTTGLNLALDDLSGRVEVLEERIHSLFELKQDKLFFWASIPSIWPSRGWVSSDFGDRRGWGGRGRRIHEGIDIAGPVGTPVIAPANGIVTYRGYRRGYGRTLSIDHGYGISTLYGHCSVVYPNEGDSMKRGTIIATIGSTGRSTGPHLHYEIRVDGVPVNPRLYIVDAM